MIRFQMHYTKSKLSASWYNKFLTPGHPLRKEFLVALHSGTSTNNTPHILGLHVAEQIATAHGGKILFCQNIPDGAKTAVWLPVK